MPRFQTMRVPRAETLRENKRYGRKPPTAYQLVKASGGRLSPSTASRLKRDEWACLTRNVLVTLCDVLVVLPGELFDKRKRP
jgi:hypothetical protein